MARTKEESRVYMRIYREKNKEKVKQDRKELYIKNRERILQQQKEYRKENKEKIKEYNKEYCQENKEKIDQYHREYYIENRDEIMRKTKEYNQNNPERKKSYNMIINAIKTGKITRPNKCSTPECNNTNNIEGHHPDYSKPLEIIWLCVSCHRILHNKQNIIQKGIKIC